MIEPFQEYDAAERYAGQREQISRFLTNWNNDPKNRSSDARLLKEMLQAKEQMIENLELSLARGEKTDKLLNRSEDLVETSI